jgi:hypothetical protein
MTVADQWAATWTDEGHLYSAWGVGTGFGHSGGWDDRWTTYLGIACIEDNPPERRGCNIWGGYQPESESSAFYRNRQLNENLKPNSILVCIDGILYLWAIRKEAGIHGQWSLSRLLISEQGAKP